MCGIVGAINTRINLDKALEIIKHRGPDAQGVYENSVVQFGHVRLSIIDLSNNSNQPFIDQSTGSALVFNGEIYNYKQLKSSLQDRVKFLTESDTEVLFFGLQLYGIEFINELQGMYSFAYYDGIKNQSYLVRDRFGIKPLYLKKDGGGYLFSSEIKAIRNAVFTPDQINKERLADFIYRRRLDHTNETFYNSIEQLPAGSFLIFEHDYGTSGIVNYYRIPCIGNGGQDINIQELKEKIVETVNSHLIADVPIGSFLSGGIDSSIISHVISTIVPDEVAALSGRTVFDHSENKLIESFLRDHPKTSSIQFQLNGDEFYEEIFNVIYHHDEPILDGSMYSHYMLCKKAKDNGLKVVLSGSGGDEIFGGYESHVIGFLADHLRMGQVGKFVEKFNRYVKFHHQNKHLLIYKIAGELLGGGLRDLMKKVRGHRKFRKLLTIPTGNDDFKTSCNSFAGANFERSLKYQTVPPYLHYEDRNSMAFGVEIRVPFLDHKLVEYVSNVSLDGLFNGTTKSLLRSSFQSEISSDIIFQSKKEGFPSPIDTSLKTDKRLKKYYYEKIKETPFLNIKECIRLADDFYLNGNDLVLFWRVLSYMIWFDINTNGKAS